MAEQRASNFRTMHFEQDDWRIEVDYEEWCKILMLFEKFGCRLSLPVGCPPGFFFSVSTEEAKRFAEAATILFEETRKEPLAAYSVINFSMGLLAEIKEMAAAGAFIIRSAVTLPARKSNEPQ